MSDILEVAVEKERLRFEGDLDRWMKIIGAGITGYQPEAYAVMDWACEELVKARAEIEKMRYALRYIEINDVAYLKAPISPPPKGYPGHFAGIARSALKENSDADA